MLMTIFGVLKEQVVRKFQVGMPLVDVVQSKDVSFDLELRNMRLVCEDQMVSMRSVGLSYKAINLAWTDVPIIEPAHLDFILEVVAATLDIESQAASGPFEERLKQQLLESDVFQRSRSLLLAIS